MYAKQLCPKPRFSDEALCLLKEYYVHIRTTYGSPRILNTIMEIAKNISRLKLKQTVDAEDVKETVQFYNVMLQQLVRCVIEQ